LGKIQRKEKHWIVFSKVLARKVTTLSEKENEGEGRTGRERKMEEGVSQ